MICLVLVVLIEERNHLTGSGNMVKQSPVNVIAQILYCVIPYLWIYAFYRIEKLRFGLLLILLELMFSISLQTVLPFPYGLIVALASFIIVPIPLIIKWSIEWNKKFSNKQNIPTT